jgi:hypothetical protein
MVTALASVALPVRSSAKSATVSMMLVLVTDGDEDEVLTAKSAAVIPVMFMFTVRFKVGPGRLSYPSTWHLLHDASTIGWFVVVVTVVKNENKQK